VTRISVARLVGVSAGLLLLVGFMLFSTVGSWRASAWQALARIGGTGDYVATGVRIVPPSATSSTPGDDSAEESDGMSKTDFEGDEVSPALATYGIDRDGNLFEVHSPHTEVPHLPGPTI
jgi:hypothetical protein